MEYSSDVDVEGGGEDDVTSFVRCGIGVSYGYGGFEVGSGRLMFLHKVPIYGGDLGFGGDEGMGVNIFQGMQGYYYCSLIGI